MAVQKITHRQRIETCLAGAPNDRVPVALWRHFPVDDQTPDGLAAATAQFQHTFDFDLVKVTPSSSFCLRDWGVEDTWRANPEGTRDYVKHVIVHPDDWAELPILDPREGWLGRQLECLRLLTREFGADLPIIQTIFSPLTQAKHLVAAGELPVHIHRDPDAFEAGLQRIAETTQRFMEEAQKTGIAGFFYAVQFAQYGLLAPAEFLRFGKQFDVPLLAQANAQGSWLNLLHLHGENLMFDQALDYPAQIINWHDRQTPPTLAEGQVLFPGTVCGGVRQWDTMVLGTPAQVAQEVKDAIHQTGGKRLIVGTGCVVPVIAPYGNLMAARRTVEEYSL
jgi:uroporphyrinogen decarboxylase